jgi:hypothetical protein
MKNIILNIKFFFKNFYFVFLRTKNIPKSFAGYGRYWLAKRYAKYRTSASSPDGITGRKRHFVFEYGDNIVLVCNRSEVNGLIQKKIISKKIDINYMVNHAHYITK